MKIRKPHEEELEEVYKLMFYIPEMEIVAFEKMKECIRENRFPEILVAIENGEVIGTAIFTIMYDLSGDGEIFLYALSVKPEHRRKMVGTSLINAVREEAKMVNASIIMFIVHRENEGALFFYKTFGLIDEDLDNFMRVAIPVEEGKDE